MQTRTEARSKLKGFITRNKNHSYAGKTRKMHKRDKKTNLCKTREETWKHGKTSDSRNRQMQDYRGDGEDLTKTERKTGD